ncbi:hypothetical protein XF30_03420 [Bradyrhizobium sp. SUTN9-2]|nr:hypothetical protein XF30_03420 [Bradyrhizobium sp. SUTN9-2]
MVTIARARLLASSEADSIGALADHVVRRSQSSSQEVDASDPLLAWFSRRSAATIRSIECGIREYLVSDLTISTEGVMLENLSGIAATFYVALFALCRQLARRLQSSNPTWLKFPSDDDQKISERPSLLIEAFKSNLQGMASALRNREDGKVSRRYAETQLRVADSTAPNLKRASVDLILTSPPYCTRIDYTSATRIEFAVLAPLADVEINELRRQMIGSIRVPVQDLSPKDEWGPTCNKLLRRIRRHPSKASAGYYYRTHLDYFDKMSRSIASLSKTVRRSGSIVFVVQDSFYKDIHNDLPAVMVDMFGANGLDLYRREDFRIPRSMAGINRYTKLYKRDPGATEAVLFFAKA